MNNVFFREEQKFREWWQILLITGSTVPVMVIIIYTIIRQYLMGVPVGDSPAPLAVLIGVLIMLIISLWMYFTSKLEVSIEKDGIHYRFFPIIYKNKFISKEEIQRYEIRQFKAKWEYGGRGVRNGFLHKWGKAFIVNGNTGLQLYLKNGKKILFGTQRSQAIIYAMNEMMKDN
jgi:hypothetical protein